MEHLPEETLKRLELAQEFSKRIYKDFGSFIKTIVFFGSGARADHESDSDIDVLVIVDDVTVQLSREIVDAYRLSVHKHVHEVSHKLHVTSLKISAFWEMLKTGDPVALNILRDGVAIIDSGFFDPFKTLLERGRIRPSTEAMRVYLARAERTMGSASWHVNQACIDLYWAVVDAVHALLMHKDIIPPRPEQMVSELARLRKEGTITELTNADLECVGSLVKAYKRITRDRKARITGAEYDRLAQPANSLVSRVVRALTKR